MVWIPGRTFRMGSDKHYPEERPAHRVSVNGFWMDRAPVTNARFSRRHVIKRGWPLWTLGVGTVLAVVLTRLFDLRNTVEIALVALGDLPDAAAAAEEGNPAGGRQLYALALMVTMAALAVVACPLVVLLLGADYGWPFGVAPGTLARIVLVTVLLPLVAGIAVRAWLPGTAERLASPRGPRGERAPGARRSHSAHRGVALFVGCGRRRNRDCAAGVRLVIGLLVGHLLGGPDPDTSVVLALSTASRHPAIALSIASVNFPDERFGGTILLYLIVGTLPRPSPISFMVPTPSVQRGQPHLMTWYRAVVMGID